MNDQPCKRVSCPSRLSCTRHPESMVLVNCPYCQRPFADEQSRNEHVLFCRLKSEREGGVQE